MFCRTVFFFVAIGVASSATAQEVPDTVKSDPNSGIIPPSSNSYYSLFQPGEREQRAVSFSYTLNREIGETVPTADGKTIIQRQIRQQVVQAMLETGCDLTKIDLPGDGTRKGVQAVTAARHIKLLQVLREAKTDSEKEEAAKMLAENYRAHYKSETDWRMKSIAELEKRLEEMRAQVKERASSEEKYVDATMTLSKLHAQGLAAEPPKLFGSNGSGQNGFGAPLPAYGVPPNNFPSSNSNFPRANAEGRSLQ